MIDEGSAMLVEAKGSERRKFARKDLLTKVEYTCEGGRYFGRTIDVSKGGMCIETFFAHKVNQQVALMFRVFEGRDPVVVKGDVVWVKEVSKPTTPTQVLRKRRIGVRFAGLDESMAKSLHYYLVDEVMFR
ncbi:MAG: PilZ domain-containing protein [Pseudomonadota bacterium]